MIAIDLAQQRGENVKVEPNEEEPAIVKSTISSEFGYMMIVIKNDAPSSGYKETVEFPKFEGLTLMAPESGNGYEVSVPAGETKVVLIKQDCRGYGYSMSFSSSIEMDDSVLIQKCIDEGEKAERGEGIYAQKLQHSGGLIFVYKNETQDKKLSEELGLDLTGLRIDGQAEDDQSMVKITIGPGEQQVVNLKTTGGGWGFGSSCSYSIADV